MTIARCIDFETTGVPEEEHAEVIEMARYDVDLTTREIGNPWSSLCLPRGPIPAVAKAVHHITEADVADARPARELWDLFLFGNAADDNSIGLSSHDVLVAHNAKFEQAFCPATRHSWICTYKVARVVWPDSPTHSNQGLRYWLNLPVNLQFASPPHRALPDAYVTAHLFVRLLAEKRVEEMIHISKYPALLKIMNFGKHKGMTFEAAPIDYLEWIRDKSDMDEDTKFTARYWVRKRVERLPTATSEAIEKACT